MKSSSPLPHYQSPCSKKMLEEIKVFQCLSAWDSRTHLQRASLLTLLVICHCCLLDYLSQFLLFSIFTIYFSVYFLRIQTKLPLPSSLVGKTVFSLLVSSRKTLKLTHSFCGCCQYALLCQAHYLQSLSEDLPFLVTVCAHRGQLHYLNYFFFFSGSVQS